MTLQQLKDWLDKITEKNNLTGNEEILTEFDGLSSIYVEIPGEEENFEELLWSNDDE